MFLSSMVFPANLEICLIFVMEQVSGKLRARITSVSFIMWTMGMCFVPLLAWLTRDWILLGIVSSLPFIPFVFVLWAFPESPRWLLSKGRSKAAFKAFQRIAKSNRRECPPELRFEIETLTKEIKNIDPWVEVLLAVICKTLINISFLVVYIQLAELLPTSHRSAGTGMASIISSVIAISSPYIAYSGTYWSTLPYVILMAIGSVGIVASLFLPETLGETLPQTLLDAEKFLVDQPFFSYLGWRPGGKKKILPVKV
ncbi:Carcinine transporter [Armadillidium nasatum]|uniref:Carcinine transporter n=1 Tax=Armadillidium nasatum TaxID=96803 RepID=A0A5N5SPJ5_9CRUS|nr:Carcinine transporter [Armadillidium nasatum]